MRMMRKRTDALAVMNAEDFEIAREYPLCRGEVTFMRGMGLPEADTALMRDEHLRAEYAGRDELLCTFVGELSERKHQSFLIEATACLRAEGVPMKLLLLGDGNHRESLERQIAELHLQDAVFLAGNREPIAPYLGISDLYVSASISEGLPFNVMEAMRAGLPILASDTKGQNDLLSEYPDTLYPLNDLKSFCDTLKKIRAAGKYGIGSRCYPSLEQYRLDAVFDENMKLFLEGENDENEA